MTAKDNFSIIELIAANIKRLKVVRIKPDGSLVPIVGANGQGKSSVLDAIAMALGGAKACPTEPVRRGQSNARIEVDLGAYKIERTFTADGGGTLAVYDKDGARRKSPQAFLDAILGSLTFDPLAFTRMDTKKQFEALRRFVPDVDFEEIAKQDQVDRDKRTFVGRQRDNEKAAANAIQYPPDTPNEPIDIAYILAEYKKKTEHNEELNEIERLRDEAELLRARASKMEDAADSRLTALKAASKTEDRYDLTDVMNRGTKAREVNAAVDRKRARLTHAARYSQFDAEYVELSKQITEREMRKREKIAAAKMPVPGLGLGDDFTVILNGIPFSQAATSEQIKTSVAIAMAMNPKLRVIFIREGSLLDKQSLQMVAEMAAVNGYQVWIERVGDRGDVGFVLEDGEVVQ